MWDGIKQRQGEDITVNDGSKRYAFFNGKYVPLEDANINIMTHAFLYGTSVFEGVRGYWNEKQSQMYLFRLREHFERMFDSMKVLYLESKYSIDELCAITVELLRMNAPEIDTYIRPTAYKAIQGIGPSLANNPTEICMFTLAFGDYFKGAGELKVIVSSWRRVEDNAIPARAKIAGSYANAAIAKTDAVLAGFHDCIMLSENGQVAEGTGMNLFMVKRGQLITTPITENILEGITRRSVMELAEAEMSVRTVTRQIDRSELYTADELFFCGTAAQVAPIVEVDKRPVGTGHTGPLTKKIQDLYLSVCHGDIPKYSHWLTPVYSPAGAGKATAKALSNQG